LKLAIMTRRAFLKTCSFTAAALYARPSSADDFQTLFDGQSLKGWHKPPKRIGHGTGGHWTVEDGILLGEQDPPGSGNGGLLLSDQKFGDFELQIDMHPDWGPDTGVFFRCTDEGAGFQMYVDYHENGNVGHLRGEMPGDFAMKPFQLHAIHSADAYDSASPLAGQASARGGTDPKGFTTSRDPRALKWPSGVYEYSCTPEQWLKAWKLNDWNSARIQCVGKYPQITTWLNDLKVCHWNGETCPLPQYDKERVFATLGREGSIGLQVHGGKGWPSGRKCRWRNIRIKTL
jgi:hypothetical protein